MARRGVSRTGRSGPRSPGRRRGRRAWMSRARSPEGFRLSVRRDRVSLVQSMMRRVKFVIGIGVIVATVAALVYSAVDQTKMYMVTVAEFLGNRSAYAGTTVRIAGRVRDDS